MQFFLLGQLLTYFASLPTTSFFLTMSVSRLVLSSPFDMPQRKRPPEEKPIKVLTSYNGCKVRNPHVNNIMVDTRVVRRSIFRTPKAQNSSWQQSSSTTLHFDRRLLGGSLFANPIVKVTGGGNEEAIRERKKKVCTPSPVKGRQHVSIQTDTRDEQGLSELHE